MGDDVISRRGGSSSHLTSSNIRHVDITNCKIFNIWVLYSGGKALPGRDADHSPQSSAEVKNE
jgi:hypothetical protein